MGSQKNDVLMVVDKPRIREKAPSGAMANMQSLRKRWFNLRRLRSLS